MLNKQDAAHKTNPIGWTDFTWNPIGGCKYDCPYCYVRRMARKFSNSGLRAPRFRPGYLNDPLGLRVPSKIFVGSAGEMFGEWVPEKDIESVLDVVRYCPRHVFQFLTKNPLRYRYFDFPANAWLGTTVDGLRFTSYNLEILRGVKAERDMIEPDRILFVSFEPLINFPAEVDGLHGIDWIILGGDSSPGADKPARTWAERLIDMAREVGAAVWVKDNYGYPDRIKEFPRFKEAPAPMKQAALI